jgi:hypothetical protein
VRSLSPVEAALCVAVGGSVLAVGIPAFVRNLHASRLVEPIDGLNRIAASAAARAGAAAGEGPNLEAAEPLEGRVEGASTQARTRGGQGAYPASVGPTPAAVPLGASTLDPPGSWEHPTWKALEFGFSRPHSYNFEFQSEVRGRKSRYRAIARGDLDGDGQTSEFTVRGEAAPGGEPLTFPLEMHREIE